MRVLIADRRLCFAPSVVYALLFLASNLRASGPPTTDGERLLGEVDFRPNSSVITVQVLSQKMSGSFLLDTGTSLNIVDGSVFPELRERNDSANLGTSNGRVQRAYFDPPDLQVGPFFLSRCGPVLRLDLTDQRRTLDPSIVGILGVSAFRDFVTQIDFDHGKVRFLWPDDRDHPEWGNAISLSTDHKVPVVKATVAGRQLEMAVAVGDDFSLSIPIDDFDEIVNATHAKTSSELIGTNTGLLKVPEMRIADFELAGTPYKDLICCGNRHGIGSVGLGLLRRNLVTFDFPNHKLYLRPGRETDAPDERNLAGIRVGLMSGSILVGYVEEGSPAEDAGIRLDDKIVYIDGNSSTQYTLDEIHRLFSSEPGKQITLIMERGGATVHATIKLRRRI
jgi:hypothetical protein